MNTLIGFFSSDARPLYKEDIYRALALPEKSIIHFRYSQKYIQEDIVSNYKKYINSEGVIFFVTGNDLSIPPELRKRELFSIRKVIVKNITKSEETRYFHFSLELQNYVDCEIIKTETEKFVSFISVNFGIDHYWIDRIKAVKGHFDDILFFRYEIFKKDNTKLLPQYSTINDDAIYHLNDESEYKLSFSFYDKKEGDSYLQITDSEHLNVHYKECSNIGSLVDDRQFKLLTRTIQQSTKPDFLKITPMPIPESSKLKYEVVSLFEINKGSLSTWLFGILSSFAFLAIILSQVAGSLLSLGKPISIIFWISVAAVLSFGVSGAILFYKFNKK